MHNQRKKHQLLAFCLTATLATGLTQPASIDAASKIKLNRTSVSVKVGKTVTLKIKGTKQKVKWSTKNRKIASVSQKGVVRGKRKGKTYIFAVVKKKKYKCKVTVKAVSNNNTATNTPVVTTTVIPTITPSIAPTSNVTTTPIYSNSPTPIATTTTSATASPVIPSEVPATSSPVPASEIPATSSPVATLEVPATSSPVPASEIPATSSPVATLEVPTSTPVPTNEPVSDEEDDFVMRY